jgi:microcystin-dependent protein
MGYLDNSGLSYLWGKIKTALGGKQDKESSVSVPGSGALSMSETIGSGPYTIEFTEEADPQDVSASEITYDNTESGMTATNVQDAITELSTAPKGGSGVPVGSVFWLATQTAPEGYLICDGSAASRTEYADLFAAIGTTFGAGDGSTTFALPNLRAAFIRGAGSQNGYSATFGEKQEATYIETASDDKRILKEPIRNEDKWSPNTSKTSNKVDGTATAYTYKSYFRPYNIALTPIIKY